MDLYLCRLNTTLHLYHILMFTQDGINEDEIVSEVPSIWLKLEEKKYWWPMVKNISVHINKRILPDPVGSKWTLCPEFHEYYGMFLFLCAIFRNFLLYIHPQKYILPNK